MAARYRSARIPTGTAATTWEGALEEGLTRGADPIMAASRSGVAPPDGRVRTPNPDAVPRWLARLGWSGWMIAGCVLGAVAAIAAVTILLPFATPVIVAVVLAAATQPVVGWLCRHGMRRTLAAVIATLLVPILVIMLAWIVAGSLRGQGVRWQQVAATAAQRLRSATGVDPLTPVLDASQRRGLLFGLASVLVHGAAVTAQLALGGVLAVYVLFFLLKDGPRFTTYLTNRLPLPAATTAELLATAAFGLRRYFVGTAVVAAMDAVVISLGAVVLRMPLIVVIALVTFALAFIPYVGAFLSGAFAVVIAFGSGGASTALWMLGLVLLTQNVLEGLLRPYAFGLALNMHPLGVLAATVLGAALGGVIGVFIAPAFAAIAIGWVRAIRSPAPGPDPADPAPE
jgi:predicted PurR-regulated permease PerM